ncbi:Similar to DNApol-eta: DNApol-eta (Drosophila melanogaster) [Cotesia congregata]|uniref:DNA polymerase eta n=1 Tax=Cotesia congregata TaxID=51543 RepID=A0A8J2MQ00_COTCN|nr:Similar to DNApol-eta: DNApol-eta (Drosophila melanogaster) [Cotesia congregata]
MATSEDRIIALIDMDCFFCQVETREHPEFKGKPLVVTQFNLVLAVNYEAKALGVSRFVSGNKAKEQCPELELISVPILRGKGDVSKYRAAGQEVIDVLKDHCPVIERASVDEAYLDITSLVEDKIDSITCSSKEVISKLNNTFVVGYCGDDNDEEKRKDGLDTWVRESFDDLGDIQARKLAVAGMIVEELRTEIFNKCQFRCSAGISYNKVLAKLACGLHKPNKQTILPATSVPRLFSSLPINKVRSLGGKVGKDVVESLGCNVMADLLKFSLQDLQKHFDQKTGIKLYNIARGIDHEPVTPRLICKSIGASKNFSVKQAITDLDSLKQWVDSLTDDVCNRLEQDYEENHRRASNLTISYQYYQNGKSISQSRTLPLAGYKANRIASQALSIISKSIDKPIVALSIAGGKFIDAQNDGSFVNYFKTIQKQSQQANSDFRQESDENLDLGNFDSEDCDVEGIEKVSLEENYVDTVVESRINVKLREIFPDLENIDPAVVELLPSELQQAARVYLKSDNKVPDNVKSSQDKIKNEEKLKPVSIKSPQNKVKNGKKYVKSKSSNSNNKSCEKNQSNINKFVVKNNNDTSMMIRCSECNQMILNEKYLEHCDYHVAHNLQKNINQPSNSGTSSANKRNRDAGSTPKSNKKKKSIKSYFCSK